MNGAKLNTIIFYVILTVRLRWYVEIKCQIDATDDFYCRSYCLLNHYAHHQELQDIIHVVAVCGICYRYFWNTSLENLPDVSKINWIFSEYFYILQSYSQNDKLLSFSAWFEKDTLSHFREEFFVLLYEYFDSKWVWSQIIKFWIKP
jgi:hypothetical protein